MSGAAERKESFFVTGGTLPYSADSYLEREADSGLLEALSAGRYAYILEPPQTGKSSLCVRTIARLERAGIRTAFLDLARIGGQNVTAEEWYTGLGVEFGRCLGLKQDIAAYWSSNSKLGPMQRFFGAIRDVALAKIRGQVVVFIDDVQSARTLPFGADEFFSGIRECFNRKVYEPDYGRLAFCLLGVAFPLDLVEDPSQTPFNVGERIHLPDFKIGEVQPLGRGLGLYGPDLVTRIHYWTGGHPYLTQALCVAAGEVLASTPHEVDRLVTTTLIERTADDPRIELGSFGNRLLGAHPELGDEFRTQILAAYRDVLEREPVPQDETNPALASLELSGLVQAEGRQLIPRNRIFEAVFDRAWIDRNTPHVPEPDPVVVPDPEPAVEAPTPEPQPQPELPSSPVEGPVKEPEARPALPIPQLSDEEIERRVQRRLSSISAPPWYQSSQARLAIGIGAALVLIESLALIFTATASRGRGRAETARTEAQSGEYVAAMSAMSGLFGLDDLADMSDLLSASAKSPAKGWEWRFWNRITHLDRQRVPSDGALQGTPIDQQSFAVSADGSTRIISFQDAKQSAQFKIAGIKPGKLIWTNGQTYFNLSADELSVIQRPGKVLATYPDATGCAGLRSGAVALIGGKVSILSGPDFAPKDADLGDSPTLIPIDSSIRARQSEVLFEEADSSGDVVALQLRDAGNLSLLNRIETPDGVSTGVIAQNGALVIAGTAAGLLEGLDAVTGRQVWKISDTSSAIRSIHVSAKGAELSADSSDGCSRLYKIVGGTPRLIRVVPGTRNSLLSGDGTRLVSFDADGKTIRFTNVASRTEIPGIRLPTGDYSLAAIAPDGSSVGVGSDTGWYRVDLLPRPRIAKAVKPAHPPIAVSDDGAFSMWRDGAVHLALTKTARTLSTDRQDPLTPPTIAALADGRVAYTAGLDEVEVYDPKTRKKTKFSLKSAPTAIAGADGGQMVIGDADGKLQLCNALAGAAAWSIRAHSGKVLSVRVNQSAGRVSTFSSDGTAAIWDLKTGKLVCRLTGNAAAISSLDLSPDGMRVITGSDDGSVRLWDAATGACLGALKTGLRQLLLVRFAAPDMAVSVDCRGTVNTYLAPTVPAP